MEMPPPTTEEEKSAVSKWLWLAPVAIAAIVAIVIGFLWYSNQRLRQKEATPTPEPAIEYEAEPLEEQGSSDEVSSIESDLQETDFSNLDQELDNIEAELATP